RLPIERALRAGARSLAGGRPRMGRVLGVVEVALSLVLLVGAGLLVRSFVRLRQAPLGFDPQGGLSVAVATPENRYPPPRQWRAFYEDLLARVRALRGVESAAMVMLRPLWGTTGMDWRFVVQGQSEEEAGRNPTVVMETVSADYFRTMRIRVQRGRVFTDADVEGQPGVVVLGETMARRCWPGQDPIGKEIKIPLPETPYDGQWLTVIGVVDDMRYREIQKTRLDLYMSSPQATHRMLHVVVRPASAPMAAAPGLRAAVRAVDPGLPVDDLVAMPRVVEEALGGPRFAARLFA